MLSLESHELFLKEFVDKHCCHCCSCDIRMMQFRVCHGRECTNVNKSKGQEIAPERSCWTDEPHWNQLVNRINEHFTGKSTLCIYNKPISSSDMTSFIDSVQSKIERLENENSELKQENQLIRELNGFLNDHRSDFKNNQSNNVTDTVITPDTRHGFASMDSDDSNFGYLETSSLCLNTFLSKSVCKNESIFNFLGDSCGDSRSDSLNSCSRQDHDSGCTTDTVPSQTDIRSLMSECDTSMLLAEGNTNNRIPNYHSPDASMVHNFGIDNLPTDRLVTKLYCKMLYYMNQRNLLLKQFQHENEERKKCKQQLSSLVDCMLVSLKDVESNSKVIKTLQTSSMCTL